MNKRLSLIASLIRPGIGFADVGSDHGYIPVYMAQNGYDGNIIASDINRGPLDSAVGNAFESGTADKISFILCDGLKGIQPDYIDTIVIAGMGGDLICRILDEAEWCCSGRYRLILQPMTKCEILRYWLINNGFEIEGEYLVEDIGKLYQVISARFTGENSKLSDAELYTGSRKMTSDSVLFEKRLEILTERFEHTVKGMTDGGRKKYKIDYLRSVLAQLYDLRKYHDNC